MSRKRLDRLLIAVKKVEENTSGDYRISLLFDDDKESYEHCKALGYNCYLYQPQQECVRMSNNCFKLTKEMGLNYFVFLNDDMEVHKDWLSEALKEFKVTFPDGMGYVSFNILHGSRLGGFGISVAGLTTVSFVDSYLKGIFMDETFIHNEGDGELSYRIMLLDKFKWCPQSIIHHNHYIGNPSLMDETYRASHVHFNPDLVKRKSMFQERGWTDEMLKNLLEKAKLKGVAQ